MDCFASLAMKVSGIEHKSAISRRDASEVCINVAPKNKEGAGDAGCALHPRSRVQLCEKLRTRAYRFSGNTPASPAQWLYGLWRDLPGDEFFFVTVAAGLMVETIRLDRCRRRQFDISNGCQNHTLLPYAARLRQTLRRSLLPDEEPYEAGFSAVRLHAAHRSRKTALRPPYAPTLPRPPHPIPRS